MHPQKLTLLRYCASTSLIALILLLLAWESWLAPLRSGGSNLILKTLPLLLPLFGILRGKRYTYQWSSLMIWIYFTEGVVRAYCDTGRAAQLAGLEIIISLLFFLSAIYFAKFSRQPNSVKGQ